MKKNVSISTALMSTRERKSTLMRVVFTILTIIMFASLAQAQVSQLTASVDRNSLLLDESLTLSLIATGSAERDAADFSALRENFRVSSPSFSQSTQIINGDMTRTVSWSVSLYPKSVGTFTIPSFTLDNQSSSTFNVTVLPVNAANDQPREYFVSATLDNDKIYLQQQLLYTVKIHLSRDIQRGQLSLPVLDGAVIEQIGEDEDYQSVVDGVRYRIIERKYAIIPQSSGDFNIKGPIFEAEVLSNSRRSFANFGRTTNISRRAPDIDISVMPMPANYNNTWLPSELVEISEEWQGDVDAFTVGTPITRTITLTAMGLTKEQLPSLDLPYHPSFKVYPEQPSLATVEHSNKLIAQGVFNSAIIPEQAGSFILPEVRIPWFNVNSGQTEYAVVPARTVEVAAQTLSGKESNQAKQSPQISTDNTPNEPMSTATQNLEIKGLNWLHYLLISTNILTLVLVYVVWLMRRGSTKLKLPVNESSDLSEEQAFTNVKNSLQQGNPKDLTEALNTWLICLFGHQHYSISTSLATFSDTGALDEYNKFLASQYSSQAQQFNASEFINALSSFRQTAMDNSQASVLSALYPQ